jgi:HAD superfamily hydrolase (TIGR01459 family)
MMIMPEIHPSVLPVSEKYSGILLDAYGVFWGGNEHGVLDGSKEMMETLVQNGKTVGILSNSTQLASKEINKLQLHGIVQGEHYHFLMTSGEVARSIFLNKKLPFNTPRNTFWLFGGVHPKFGSHQFLFDDTDYQETKNIDEADFIYISIPHINGEDQTDPEKFREEIAKIKSKNLPMVCANPDQFAHEGKPARAVVRQGTIAKIYEEMGGEVFYIGKPNDNVYSVALKKFNEHEINHAFEILMVGDTPETDIRGGRLIGMGTALVTETGNMADRITKKGKDTAFSDLKDNDNPHYFISRLGHAIHA